MGSIFGGTAVVLSFFLVAEVVWQKSSPKVQGGEDAWDALSCMSLSTKGPQ